MKQTWVALALGLCIQISLLGPVQAAPASPPQVKDLNFVFLHGAGGHGCNLQLLADSIMLQLPPYIRDYEAANPDTKIRINALSRCYPNDVDIETWADNIADGIDQHFPRENLILIGHSMGGKTALYSVAHNVGHLADKVAMVVTINSPIKPLSAYYFTGGADYWRARWLLPQDKGVLSSIAYYDSTADGRWVGHNKYWLALISGETTALSAEFDVMGVDPLPRDMDDTIVPVSAQYSDGADVVYYGGYGHSDFSVAEKISASMAQQILDYIFGGQIECSVLSRSGAFEHTAGWLPLTNSWEDVVGEVPGSTGRLSHRNESYVSWQEWEDVVGDSPPGGTRSRYSARLTGAFPFLTSLGESRWFDAGNPEDGRLYLRTSAAPRSSIQVEWSTTQQGLLPPGTNREHYEVEITTGTPFTEVNRVSWLSDDPRDLRLLIRSQAEGPFRWFKAAWRVYSREMRDRKLIEKIPGEVLTGE